MLSGAIVTASVLSPAVTACVVGFVDAASEYIEKKALVSCAKLPVLGRCTVMPAI